jgi:hypothetical protein
MIHMDADVLLCSFPYTSGANDTHSFTEIGRATLGVDYP